MQNFNSNTYDDIINSFIYDLASKLLKREFETDKTVKLPAHHKASIVYHYTSFDSFFKIISSESLIATNALYLNDTTEFRASIKAFEFSLTGLVQKGSYPQRTRDVITAILGNIESVNISDNYVTCFSAEHDLLSQWMVYGDRGNGLAIGFEVNELARCFQYYPNGAWVEYDASKKLNSVDYFNKAFISCLNQIVTTKKLHDLQDQIDLAVKVYFENFLPSYLSHYKHYSFSEEKEYRLALREQNFQRMHIEYMTKGSLIVPYTKFILGRRLNSEYDDPFLDNQQPMVEPTQSNFRLPIKEIILGPCVDQAFTEPGLQMFLKSNSYNKIKVKKSSIPLRNL